MMDVGSTEISFIYGLSSTNNPELIRYVGKSNNPNKRLIAHLLASKTKKTYRDKWIFSELEKGNSINIKILLCKPESEIYNWEKEIIKLYKSFGAKLVNGNEGGLGGKNPSKEVREKIRQSKIGNTWNIGKSPSEETRKKVSAAHKGKPKHTKESKQKLREINLNRPYRPNIKCRNLTEEQILEIWDLKLKGNSQSEISKLLNIPIMFLRSLWQNNTYKDIKEKYNLNFKLRTFKNYKTNDDRNKALEIYKEKQRQKKNKEYSVIKEQNKKIRKEKLNETLNLYNQGLSILEISNILNIHKRTVKRRILKLNSLP